MKSRLAKNKFRPFVIQLLKSIRQCGMKRAMGNCKGWLNKKPVLKEFYMVTNPVGVENLKAVVYLFAVIVHKILQGGHDVKLCV